MRMTIKTFLSSHSKIFVPLCLAGIVIGMISVYIVLKSSPISVVMHCPRPAVWPSPDGCVGGNRLPVDSIDLGLGLPFWMIAFSAVSSFLIIPFCSSLLAMYGHEYLKHFGRNMIPR